MAGRNSRHGHFETAFSHESPVVYKVPGLMGRGFSYTTGAEAEKSAVNLSRESHDCIHSSQKRLHTSSFVFGIHVLKNYYTSVT